MSEVSPIQLDCELSEKEWLNKYHYGRHSFSEEDIVSFPVNVQEFIKTWIKVDKNYLFSVINPDMDEANQKAKAVLDVFGTDAAVKYMMDMSHGSYSHMRSLYG